MGWLRMLGIVCESGKPEEGANRATAVAREIGCFGERLQRRKVIRSDAQQLVQRPDRDLGYLVGRRARRCLRGKKCRGLLSGFPRQFAKGEIPLGGPCPFTATLANNRLDPQHCAAALTPSCERGGNVHHQVMRSGIGYQKSKQPFGCKTTRFLRVSGAKIQL